MQAIPQVATKATNATVRAMTEVADLKEYGTRRKVVGSQSKVGRPQLRQPKADCSAQNKCDELKNFEIEVENILYQNNDITDAEKYP